jgi:hypothetical protein
MSLLFVYVNDVIKRKDLFTGTLCIVSTAYQSAMEAE